MKRLIMLFSIAILSISVLACGPAVGRAIGDAEVDVDATLATLEPETEAEQELYDMHKEIDRLHKEERSELLEALTNSSEVIDELIVLIGTDVDLGDIPVSAQNLTDGGADDSDLSDLISRAKSARDREAEILTALEDADSISDGEDLVEVVRHVQDGHAAALDFPEDLEQPADLAGR